MPFSFSGWNSFSVAPKIAGAPAGIVNKQFEGGMGNTIKAPPPKGTAPAVTGTVQSGGLAAPVAGGAAPAAGAGIPQSIIDAIGGLSGGVGGLGGAGTLALLERLFSGGLGGGAAAQPVVVRQPNPGNSFSAIRNQIHRENEAARIGLLREESRRQLIPSLPGMDYLSSRQRQIDQEIEDRLRYNLPIASGWVGRGTGLI